MTDPIVLNATFIQPSQPLWVDWLPAIVSVFIVILGYYANTKLEHDRRQFESRKQAYYELLDAARTVKCFLDRSRVADKGGPEIDRYHGYDLMDHDLNLAAAKVRIFGSNKINDIVNKHCSALFDNDTEYNIFENELIAAIWQEFSRPDSIHRFLQRIKENWNKK
jgi:hypothetical protein